MKYRLRKLGGTILFPFLGFLFFSRMLSALLDPANKRAGFLVATAVLLFDAALSFLVVTKVPYTEIDWVTYLQQVKLYTNGERNYQLIEGDTGPLVYPAGHLHLHVLLSTVTGGRIDLGQWIYAGLYLASVSVAMSLCLRSGKVAPWMLPLLALSRRVHSIFMLRLFNDCWAMFVAHIALFSLTRRNFVLAIALFSLATSIKMNVLLMAPPVLLCTLQGATLTSAAIGVALGVAIQVALGYPFLSTYPREYISRAFEFSRVFMYKWTVNLKFLPEPIFLSKRLALGLLLAHLALLGLFAAYRWSGPLGLPGVLAAFWDRSLGRPDAKSGWTRKSDSEWTAHVLRTVWTGNLIGILCARSLHYQFYSWYYFSLPFLLAVSALPVVLKLAVWLIIEVVWNLYPPSREASLALLAAHIALVGSLWVAKDGPALGEESKGEGNSSRPKRSGAALRSSKKRE